MYPLNWLFFYQIRYMNVIHNAKGVYIMSGRGIGFYNISSVLWMDVFNPLEIKDIDFLFLKNKFQSKHFYGFISSSSFPDIFFWHFFFCLIVSWLHRQRTHFRVFKTESNFAFAFTYSFPLVDFKQYRCALLRNGVNDRLRSLNRFFMRHFYVFYVLHFFNFGCGDNFRILILCHSSVIVEALHFPRNYFWLQFKNKFSFSQSLMCCWCWTRIMFIDCLQGVCSL